jgi:hypothetical protein
VNKTIPDELHDTATITKRIKRKNKCDYERVVDTYAEWIRTQTEILGEVILGGVTQSATKEQQEVFYQRPDSQWDVSFMGTKQILDHEPGFYCLAHLLGNPGERCPMSRIRGFTTASDEIPEGLYLQRDYLDESISPSKVAKVRRNLKELEALRDEAKGDHERLTQLKEDIQRTKKYLSSVLDIHGKPRRLYDRKERDRVRLHRAIDSAREAIGRKLPLLEVHLRLCIPKIGLSPAYYPNRDPNLDKPLVWILEKR